MTVYVINASGEKFKVTEWTAENQRIINTNQYIIVSVTKDEMILKYAPKVVKVYNSNPFEEDCYGSCHMV